MRTRLGRYSIVGKLGQGGMGVVYEGLDETLRRRVALKVLAEPGDASARDRFLREAQAAAALTHPNVCQIYEIGEDGDELFLALEFLEGRPLDQALTGGPLSAPEAVDICRSALAGLAALHGAGLVHRDLKPSNLFLVRDGVKLLDFGLVRRASPEGPDDLVLTRPGTTMGTPFYMAPEQWRGEPVTAATDLYAMGAVLYEMVTGAPPFPGKSVGEVCDGAIHRHPPPLAGGAGVLALDRVVQRALSKRPEDRYGSAADMVDALGTIGGSRNATGSVDAPVRALKRLVAIPFRVLKPDPETDFLAFSLPDAAAMSLSGRPSLVVRSTHAASRFAGGPLDPPTIARDLDVDAVLSGTLVRHRDRVRVNAQVMNVPDGTVVWSHQLEGTLDDLFALEDSLAGSLAASVEGTLDADVSNAVTRELPAGSAYRNYLRANDIRYSAMRPTALIEARDLYRACVDEDATMAPAWARLGRIHRIIAKYGFGDGETNRRQAREAFQRALDLEPDLPLAHNLYTFFQLEEEGDAESAMVRLLGRARAHGEDPDLFAGLVATLRFCGLLDASLAAYERARSLDPAIQTSVHHTYHLAGDWVRAADADRDEPFFLRLVCWDHLGRSEDAVAALTKAASPDQAGVEGMVAGAALAAMTDDPDRCSEYLRRMATVGMHDPEALALVAMIAARADLVPDALRLLDRAVDRGFAAATHILRDPWFDSVRAEPGLAPIAEKAERKVQAARAMFRMSGGGELLGVGTGD